ncbi:helix-turn-helix domain-containing protein [Sporosarcina gallistercoris]|uniref:Helix-turn-helix domain-containing protein n=1 Tax=Sporosarcina gallistercoris TaxID=2762245 RepID=A0ABR8PLN7_9BACL|nr:helix-turn-helix domain-containing protein [Sporosarcina gallistercoris]MBD7909081.1 helix-turn-helix domain-containing protein [Sporosarcina gallistercoris]
MSKEIEMDLYKANRLLEINKMLTQTLQLNEILHNVVQAACELVEVADVILIYLYDEETNLLRFAKGQGVNEEALARVEFAPGESITGKVFVHQQSKLFTSRLEIEEHMENMTEENARHYYEGVQQRRVKSTFCVPILNKNRCLGVVVVNNYNRDSIFTAEDMNVIEVVAGQSAIAIDNAKVYEHLQQKNVLLEKSMSIHKTFYQLIIEGRGIETVISLLERMISSTSTVRYHSYLDVEENMHTFPIRRGMDTLGYLSLTKPFMQFSEMEKIIIEQASLSIALELIKENALYEKEIHFREQVFNHLLEGLSGRELEAALHYVNWRTDTRVQCVIIEGNQKPLWQVEQLMEKEKLIKSVEQMLRSERVDPLIFTRAFQLIIILPASPEQTVQELLSSIRQLRLANLDIVYGIGRETSVQELSVSYKEAIRSVGYAKRYQIPVVEYSMLGLERLLYELDQELLERFMNDKLHRLQSADSTLIHTLKQFIWSNRNQKQTAKELHVHPNTLYYRLKKVEELLEIDFSNEKDWIDFVVAFRIYVELNEK